MARGDQSTEWTAFTTRRSRRAILQSGLVSLGLFSCRRLPIPVEPSFVPLREPVIVSHGAVANAGGSLAFEAWLTPNEGPDKLIEGLLIEAEGELVAYSTYCPHEVCPVKLIPDPSKLSDAVTQGADIPDHAVMYCGCHFSIFDPRASGKRLAGPTPRGLYRFRVARTGDTIHVTHVEAAILDLYE